MYPKQFVLIIVVLSETFYMQKTVKRVDSFLKLYLSTHTCVMLHVKPAQISLLLFDLLQSTDGHCECCC